MKHRALASGALCCLCLGAACGERAASIILTVEDPLRLAALAQDLAVGRDAQALQRRALGGKSFPVTVTLVGERLGEPLLIWAEALDGAGRVLGRGSTVVTFERAVTKTATIRLGRACADDSDCDDGAWCTGLERCSERVCVTGALPCPPSALACVETGCVEALRQCSLTIRHEQCGPVPDPVTGEPVATFCHPINGCVPGDACSDDQDCQNGSVCDGDEVCEAIGRCGPGVPPLLSDDSPCTIDVCVEPQGVVHVPDPALDGTPCTLPGPGPTAGVCAASRGGCSESVCGDGVLDRALEECDDGNTDPTDRCLPDCTLARCGDGYVRVDSPEVCDDGNTASGDGCRGDCGKVEQCGDQVLDAGEDCDDGNVNPADGCDQCRATGWHAAAVIGGNAVAIGVGLSSPTGVAVDGHGNLFVADTWNHRIRKVTPAGVISNVAGTGSLGYAGDGGQATSARINLPRSVALDGLGNLYVADTNNHRIRKVTAAGVISTVAGTGTPGFTGDGGLATSAQLSRPNGVAVDGLGNLYVADTDNCRIRKVTATGLISTVAGTGTPGSSGDGGLATGAQLNLPYGVAVDGLGSLFVADTENHRIRKVTTAGVISTVAGTGTPGFSGDGGPAASAQLKFPRSVVSDGPGNLFVADAENSRIRMITSSGVIDTVAGTGAWSFSGDGGLATSARLHYPCGVAVDRLGNLFVADSLNHRIRKVTVDGVITTVAGTGSEDSSGDGGLATSAPLQLPYGIAVDALGNLFTADHYNPRIRKVATDGVINTVAGTGIGGFSGDGGLATNAQVAGPNGVAADGLGNLFVVDTGNHRIRKVTPAGVISTVAGTGTQGYSGDGGLATSAQINVPLGVTVDGLGNLFVADSGNHRIRQVAPDGAISTVAGTGTPGFSGDGGLAISAQINNPSGVAVDGLGDLFIADRDNHRIRRITAAGVISTEAGTDTQGFSGDGGLATSAQLSLPNGVAIDDRGNLFVADTDNQRIRMVATDGHISTVAGTGAQGFSGDGGLATNARFSWPRGVTIDEHGNLFVADRWNYCIRKVTPAGIISTVAGQVAPEGMGPQAQARLATPLAVTRAADDWLFAGGVSGTVQRLRTGEHWLEVVAGRYPHTPATANLARLRASDFGAVAGVAFDVAAGLFYLAESSANRLHAVSIVGADAASWTIALLAGGASGAGGYVDGPAVGARFREPTGLHLDVAARVLYIADSGNHAIRAIDLAGGLGAATVSTVAGTPGTLGFFGDGGPAMWALLFRPEALTRCPNGDLFIADTGNHRVRRVDGGGVITTVLGDGTASSSGEGRPALSFPVQEPRGLMCDAFGNLYVTSTRTVRLLAATDAGVVDGEGPVQTIYGGPPRDSFPASISACLTGLYVTPDDHVWVTDSCEGLFIELWRAPLQ